MDGLWREMSLVEMIQVILFHTLQSVLGMNLVLLDLKARRCVYFCN